MRRAHLGLLGLLGLLAGPALAQDAPQTPPAEPPAPPAAVRIDPRDGAAYQYVLDRRTTVRETPGVVYDPPLERQVVSYVSVTGSPAPQAERVVLHVTYQRVHGFEKGGLLTSDVTFDRKASDPPGARPETLLVGRTVDVEVERDGRIVAIRGVGETLGSSTSAILGALGDVHALVPLLPPDGRGAESWETEESEGQGLLRTRVDAKHTVEASSDAELTIVTEGTIAAAPQGAGPEFERSFEVRRGRRTARSRVARGDGLLLEARHVTDYAVDALLTGSGVRAGVDSDTVISVRRTATGGDATAAPPVAPRAPTAGGKTPNRGLPGWIGTSRDVIVRLAGEPTTSGPEVLGGSFQTFATLGLVYVYDDDGFVRRVIATRISGGEAFTGKVLGVALGDHIDVATDLWGEPTVREPARPGATVSSVAWTFDTLQIELEVWSEDADDPPFGERHVGEVKRIRVTARAPR